MVCVCYCDYINLHSTFWDILFNALLFIISKIRLICNGVFHEMYVKLLSFNKGFPKVRVAEMAVPTCIQCMIKKKYSEFNELNWTFLIHMWMLDASTYRVLLGCIIKLDFKCFAEWNVFKRQIRLIVGVQVVRGLKSLGTAAFRPQCLQKIHCTFIFSQSNLQRANYLHLVILV